MKSATIVKRTEIDIQESFFFYPYQYLQELKIKHQLVRPHFLKKLIHLADH